jgi:hypothetical protein
VKEERERERLENVGGASGQSDLGGKRTRKRRTNKRWNGVKTKNNRDDDKCKFVAGNW